MARESPLDLRRALRQSNRMRRWQLAGRKARRCYALVCALVLVASNRSQALDYFVDPSGANGAHPTVQSALEAIDGQTAINRANVFIAPATYIEQLTVDKPFVTFIGQGETPTAVKISFNDRPAGPPTY